MAPVPIQQECAAGRPRSAAQAANTCARIASFTPVAATGPSRQKARLARDEQRPVWFIRQTAMRSLHQAGIERNDIHERAKPERPLGEAPAEREFRNADRRIEKQFHRIVARLAVDLDQPREVRRAAVVEPVVIGEPGIRARQRDELAGARMVEAERALLGTVEHAFDARQGAHDRAHLADQRPGSKHTDARSDDPRARMPPTAECRAARRRPRRGRAAGWPPARRG